MYNVLHSLRLKSESKMRKRNIRLFYFLMVPLLLSAVALRAEENKTYSGEFIIEPPTLISLGFEWYIDGDDNRNAGVSVHYRKRGDMGWREALPLLRLQREELINNYGAYDYVVPNMFAGSIMDLQEDTEYEVQLTNDGSGWRRKRNAKAILCPHPRRTEALYRWTHIPCLSAWIIKENKQEPSFTGSLGVRFIPRQMERTGLTPTRPG